MNTNAHSSYRNETASAEPQEVVSFYTDLAIGTFAYHTTNVVWSYGSPKPDFKELKWHPANDAFYDRIMVGFPAIFFSTTLREDGLPRYSPYPTSGTPGTKFWRLKIPLKFFNKYDTLWLATDNESQKQLVLATEEESAYFKNVRGLEQLDLKNNPYLCKRGDLWLVNNYDTSYQKFFVNFLIYGDFPLEFCVRDCLFDCKYHCKYDYVTRNKMGAGNLIDPSSLVDFCNDSCKENCNLHKEKFTTFCRNHTDREALAEEARNQWYAKQRKIRRSL